MKEDQAINNFSAFRKVNVPGDAQKVKGPDDYNITSPF